MRRLRSGSSSAAAGVRGMFAQRRRVAGPDVLAPAAGRPAIPEARRSRCSPRTPRRHRPTESSSSRTGSAPLRPPLRLPVVSCVWSSGQRDALGYPAAYLFAFLSNHGFLAAGDAPQWYVVEGGSRIVRRRDPAPGAPHQVVSGRQAVTRSSVIRTAPRSPTATGRAHGSTRSCSRPTPTRRSACSPTPRPTRKRCSARSGTPRTKPCCTATTPSCPATCGASGWNFRLPACAEHCRPRPGGYWMNRLQHQPAEHPLVVTLNRVEQVDPGSVIAEMTYTHPIYTPRPSPPSRTCWPLSLRSRRSPVPTRDGASTRTGAAAASSPRSTSGSTGDGPARRRHGSDAGAVIRGVGRPWSIGAAAGDRARRGPARALPPDQAQLPVPARTSGWSTSTSRRSRPRWSARAGVVRAA